MADIKSINVSHITISGHKLKRSFGTKYKRYRYQRPIDQNHVLFLRSEFIKEGNKFKTVVGQFVLARTQDETVSNSKYSVLDGNHRWNAILGITDEDPFLDNTFQCLIYDNINYKMQRELFRNINSGKPMCGMYYDDDYLNKTAKSTIKKLKIYFPGMITNDTNKLWMCSYNQKDIEDIFTRENMNTLGLTDLRVKSIVSIMIELNKKILISLTYRIHELNWLHDIEKFLLITNTEWISLLELYKNINCHNNVRNIKGLKKTIKYIIETFIKHKRRVNTSDIPCFLPLIWKTDLMDIILNYDKYDELIEESDDSITIDDNNSYNKNI
jgi:hypothetical protein